MADGIEISFDGIPQFSARMIELAGPVAEKIARHAVRAGAEVVRQAISERAPVRDPSKRSKTALPPGALKGDIVVKTAKEPDGSISAYIEPGSYTIARARMVEYGHALVRGGYSKMGAGILGQGRRGPGTVIGEVPAHPFVRPAFDESQAAAQDAIAMDLAEQFADGLERSIGPGQVEREDGQ